MSNQLQPIDARLELLPSQPQHRQHGVQAAAYRFLAGFLAWLDEPQHRMLTSPDDAAFDARLGCYDCHGVKLCGGCHAPMQESEAGWLCTAEGCRRWHPNPDASKYQPLQHSEPSFFD